MTHNSQTARAKKIASQTTAGPAEDKHQVLAHW